MRSFFCIFVVAIFASEPIANLSVRASDAAGVGFVIDN